MTVENHIHLDLSLTVGAENAPETKWKIRQDGWLPVPIVVETHRRTINGRLKKHRLRDASNNIIRLKNYKYILRVSDYWDMTKQERLDMLIAMQGEEVYLVDSIHCPDGSDHTSFVRPMYFSEISEIKNINPQLDPLYISIELLDDTI